ncbi:DUF6074 family protein [Rhizobium sp. BK251]|uniref:DUF6074 family protein n=1 Tax=Rhizobium sp. BK251 TaxID=2512125 RepID=UPI001050661C|nr:DUF6074 family protein [Rhizobium sp. BK251]TCL70560.1 hypothetical protein EV286_107435 [Rhizobium sp. BK251]
MSDTCRIIVFPLAKRVGKIRRFAAVFSEMNPRAAVGYWNKNLNHMIERMQTLGMTGAEIDRQIVAFMSAVQRAIDENGKGAA